MSFLAKFVTRLRKNLTKGNQMGAQIVKLSSMAACENHGHLLSHLRHLFEHSLVSPDVSQAFHAQQSAGLQTHAAEHGDSQATFLLPASTTVWIGSRTAALLEFGFSILSFVIVFLLCWCSFLIIDCLAGDMPYRLHWLTPKSRLHGNPKELKHWDRILERIHWT